MLTINTNISNIIAQNSLKQSTNALNQAIERMTTGFKINHAKDNAANYSIATNMQTKINAYNVAADNVAMGMDLITTASDTISLMQDYGTRLKALATQARNGTYGEQSIDAINAEVNAIMKEINRLSSISEYNGVSLFDGGTEGNGFIFDPVSYSEAEVTAMTTMTELVEGATSADNKYSISSAAELEAFAKYVNDGNNTAGMTFVLGANIDLSSIPNWTPIGNSANNFDGAFDGNGHIVKNLKIDSTEDYQGLFGYISGEIQNIGVENCDVKGGNNVGGLVGSATTIINCYATGDVSGTSRVGGLVGYCDVTLHECYATCNVNGISEVGGLVGFGDIIVDTCYATGNVCGRDRGDSVGGLVGKGYGIINSYAYGNVCGGDSVGGLAGFIEHNVSNSYASGDVSATRSRLGGLVGHIEGNISGCYVTGNVSGDVQATGGLAGEVYGNVTNSYTAGVVIGSNGYNHCTNSADWNGTKFTYDYNYETTGFTINTSGGLGAFTLQVGINGDESCRLDLNTNFVYALGAVKSDIASDRALEAITAFTSQLSEKSTQLGAVQNRLMLVI